ncbi:NADP oxidoreductase (plasmid) [Halarchaeum sp. CBA1220]|uniref:NADH-ubiquinone oxidoreductase-F iron-sulfur binding region domain-containing protein n=1 Tax=Halarchaeum sp. CBA1220 TaxID=1853682 RepID=UPI000F3A8CBC|nr:NADH-ubiquinone oxidoreductase-F iron-sulfur binding region domain-containing protein [Halarchaeum sp. CBA1220]QLC34975.1 NADP oxidoreductase [Halarchaeum sp. CBA1220]
MANLQGRTTAVRVAGTDASAVVEDVAGGDVPVAAVGSTGVRALEPLLVATHDGESAFVANADAGDVEAAVAALGDGDLPDGADARVSHGDTPTSLPAPDLDGFAGDRAALARCGWIDPRDPEAYDAAVGFSDADADAVIDAAADLRGRGWGDWSQDEPLGDLWAGVRERDDPAVVVVNAHGNPGDALLLESDPFAVLDGANAAARAVGADAVFVYASEGDDAAAASAHAAADAGDFDVPVEVVEGPAVYRAAEPTMAIEAIEGNHRLEARLRPPGPEVEGVYGDPTVVHTARTYAHLAGALAGASSDSRVVSVTGDVATPTTVELDESATVADAVDAAGVGEYTAACVGGKFGGLTRDLDVALAPDALSVNDLGTEGVVEVLGADECPVAFVGRRANVASETNCGRCVPCREGTTQLTEKLRDVYDGTYDEEGIEELSRVMASTSICAFGRDVPRTVRTAMDEFDDAFEAHAAGDCPTGACTGEL